MPAVSSKRYNYSRKTRKAEGSRSKRLRPIRIMLALIFVIGIFAMLIESLILRIRLTAVSDANLQAEQRLDELYDEQKKLEIEYEQSIDLEAVEEYARNELGMRKPGPDQKKIINADTYDKAVIIEKDDASVGKSEHLIGCIKEYFK